MDLAGIFRNVGLPVIAEVTDTAQANISHYPWTGSGDYGEPTYGSVVVRKGVVQFEQRLRHTADGQEIMQKASIQFVGPITANGATDRREPVDPRDKMILPNGYTGPILEVLGAVDPLTGFPYAPEVILG